MRKAMRWLEINEAVVVPEEYRETVEEMRAELLKSWFVDDDKLGEIDNIMQDSMNKIVWNKELYFMLKDMGWSFCNDMAVYFLKWWSVHSLSPNQLKVIIGIHHWNKSLNFRKKADKKIRDEFLAKFL